MDNVFAHQVSMIMVLAFYVCLVTIYVILVQHLIYAKHVIYYIIDSLIQPMAFANVYVDIMMQVVQLVIHVIHLVILVVIQQQAQLVIPSAINT